jgi:outer membrane receptor protein involved in Fe transport
MSDSLDRKRLVALLATALVTLSLPAPTAAQMAPAPAPAPAAAPSATPDAAAMSAPPSTAPATEEVVKMEAFGVTGSNILRMDQEKVLPVTQLDNDAMEARAALQPIDMITALPEVDGVPANESANGGAGQRGDIATVNMRGIGSQFTLLLLDGRRLAPHPIISVLNASPNASQYPNQGIDHIDVLRDGASSIYGTDAVAGVINYVMKREFVGEELKVKYGAPQHGGAQQVEATLTVGRAFPDNKGHVTATVDYLYRDALFDRQRSFSANGSHVANAPAPLNTYGSAYDANGTNPIWTEFYLGSGGIATYQIPQLPSGAKLQYFYPTTSATALPTITTTAPGKGTTPWFYEPLNSYQMILPRTNRENAFVTIDHDIIGRISFFSDISYYHARSTLERQPQSLAAPGADYYKVVSANNPYNPYGSWFYTPNGALNPAGQATLVGTPQALTLVSRELIEEGPEHIEVNDGLYRIVAGIKGRIGETWTWESGILYTRAEATDISHETRESALATALGNTTLATAYNPFGYNFAIQNGAVVATTPFTNPKSVVSGFLAEWRHEGFSSVSSIDAKASGEIVTLWAGPISAAAGGEFRIEDFADKRAPYAGLNPPGSGLDPLNNDFITASPKPDSTGSRKVTSAYAETVVPLVAPKNNIAGINSLEATGSGRFERYNDFGNTTRPKMGLNYKPAEFLMLRASFNEGFSAPSLPLVHYGQQYSVGSQPGTVDPYYQTVAPSQGQYIMQSQTTALAGLQPSTSIGRSLGAVLDVPFAKGLSFSADYWQISQNNLIGTGPPGGSSFSLQDDQAKLIAYTQSQLAAGVNINNINAGSGTANYHGSQYIVRNAPTSSDIANFAAYNATHAASAQQAAVGTVYYSISTYQNLAKSYLDGWDLGGHYNFPKTPFGNFSFNTEWSYMMRNYTLAPVAGAGLVETDLINSSSIPRWRGTGTLTWRWRGWQADLGAYYIGKFQDSATVTAAQYLAVGAPSWIEKQFNGGVYTYKIIDGDTLNYNLGVSYRFKKTDSYWVRDTSIRVGVIDLLDEKPPLASGNTGFDTGNYNQLAIGREFTFEVTRHF